MNPQDFIEPSLADAPAIRPALDHRGRPAFIVHGIALVYTLQEALALLIDQ